MAASSSVDRETFLANVRRSGLLTDEQLTGAAERLPIGDRGRPVARALVEIGLLTRFQLSQLLAGRTSGFFLGQYRILDHIGQGGMGRVFKAEHRTLSRIVAIKVLAPRLLKTARAQELFRREIRAAGRLMHPNIVTAFDANQEGARIYLVMEYVAGPNLHQLVKARGPLPIAPVCDYIRQTAEGLHYAHLKGMIHRDVKPGNLLLQNESIVGRDGQLVTVPVVKISDFGLARLTEPGATAGSEHGSGDPRNVLMGTPDYVAPEQARDHHKADTRSDLYSLGCTFYHLLSGRLPFPGGGPLEKLVRHTSEEVPAVGKLRPEVPAALAAIVARLMAKRPEDRFATAAEVATALAPFCGTSPQSDVVRPPSVPLLDLTTPSDGPASDAVDDSSALAGTELPENAATSLASSRLPIGPRPGEAERERTRRWLSIAVLAGAAIGGLLISGVIGWLLATR